MERNESESEAEERESTKDQDVEHFDDYEEFRERLYADLAEDTNRTPEEIREAVESYPMPDPEDLERIPAEEFYDG